MSYIAIVYLFVSTHSVRSVPRAVTAVAAMLTTRSSSCPSLPVSHCVCVYVTLCVRSCPCAEDPSSALGGPAAAAGVPFVPAPPTVYEQYLADNEFSAEVGADLYGVLTSTRVVLLLDDR